MLEDCGRAAALGVDIGGTAIKAGWVRPSGEVAAFFTFPTPIDRPQDDAILLIARALLDFCDGDTPLAVGVGCAGLVSSRSGIVHVSPNLPLWQEAPLGPLLAQELGSPVFVLNDANAFALAEARVGAGGGFSPVVALTLGTGVGGAIVVDGRLAEGLHGFGGEVGHMSVSWEGPPCPCGSRGCVEVFVGRRALVEAYFSRSEWSPGVVGHDLAAGNRDAVDPKLLAAAAAAGDRVAAQVFNRAGEILGAALANLSNLIDPALFVIGGGVAQAGGLVLEPARRILAARAMIGPERAAKVVPAALGVRAGLIGAALYAYDSLSAASGDRA